MTHYDLPGLAIGVIANGEIVYRRWFGAVSICVRGDTVRFEAEKSPLLSGTVMRVGDRRLVDRDDDSVDAEAWLDFTEDENGRPTLTTAKVDPEADFSFDYEDLKFAPVRTCVGT
jgi:hypothetical protein